MKCIGLKVRTFYIRGSCGGAWVDLEFYKIARFQDLEKSKMVPQPASLGWEGEQMIFENLKFELGGSGCRGSIHLEELVWTLLGR